MSAPAQAQGKATATPIFTAAKIGSLQRQCACGGTPGVDGECAECRGKRLQRKSFTPLSSFRPTLTTHQGLLQRCGADGECAECRAQRLSISRSGYDFSRLPIHSPQTAVPQTKLTINQPGDIYEREADQVAEHVMRMTDPETVVSDDEGEVKNSLMRKQRVKPGAHAAPESPDILPVVQSVLSSGGGQPLDTTTRAFMEPRFGHDFGQVRVHTDERAGESAQEVNAFAYTVGRNIVFRAGQYAPETSVGKSLLAHELTHVVQQEKASSTHLQGKLTGSQASDASEHEAEAQAATVMEEARATEGTPPSSPSGQTGHLTSPRFAGDEKLEACYQDKDRLREGDHGEAVIKIQQALVDLDYELGDNGENRDGVDGTYGPKTAAAVREFKADHHLGFEQYGDVGPGTMRQLDILFPIVTPQPKVAAKDTPLECPFEDEGAVQDAVEKVHPHAMLAAPVPEQAGTSSTGDSQVHLSIEEAVKRYKQAVNVALPQSSSSSSNVAQAGQFFWDDQVEDAIREKLNKLNNMKSDQTARHFAKRAEFTIDAINSHADNILTLIGELDTIERRSKSPQKPVMHALLSNPPDEGKMMEAYLWRKLNESRQSLLPNLHRYLSIRTYQSLFDFDKNWCGIIAGKLVERLKKRGGIKPVVANSPRINVTLATGRAMRDRRPGLVDPTTLLGDIIEQKKGIRAIVEQMKLALNGGRQIEARVLSGVGYNKEPPNACTDYPCPLQKPPPEEHSLIIIGYDGDVFVFADPDATTSHTPEDGFGVLFFDSAEGRLSTAQGPLDLYVTSDGYHRQIGQRSKRDHRYQVIRLASFE